MFHYILRRLLIACLTAVMITFLVYGLIRNMPGDPLSLLMYQLGEAGSINSEISAVYYKEMQKELGLDRPWLEGYLKWLGDILHADLGKSLITRAPVTEVIGPRLGPTLLLSCTSLVLAYLLSIPLGLYCGVRSGSWPERVLSTLLYMLYSLPSFVAALYLLVFLSLKLDWFPLSGMWSKEGVPQSLSGKAWDLVRHMALPVACYTYGSLAYYVRFIRSNLQEVIRQDYVRTARAKGLSEAAVVLKHAFRNTLIPLVTLLGLTLPGLLSGSVILERIFVWPGMGQLFLQKIYERDYPVIMGLVLLFSVLVLLGNLLADLLYALVDPRISYS
jgi:peptide/nickel transport system permease protein